jgi:chitobiase/beta-hexosaminidase-like protein
VSLQDFQLDVAARLEASAYFEDVPVLVFRPRAALTAAEIQDQINMVLGALTTQNGKAGLCVTVMMPGLSTKEQELPGPYLHLKCVVRVQENVMVNMGSNGTMIACEDAAIAVAQILHLWTPGGTAGIVRVAEEAISAGEAFEGNVTYDVMIESEVDLPCLEKTAQPFIASSGDLVSIGCADSAAAIYYTTDGTAPWAGNESYPSTGVLYEGSFTVGSGTLVRAAAFNPAKLGSDTDWLQL